MSLFSELLPGVRYVRGPLIAGYLWLFIAWLLLADVAPERHRATVYARAYEAVESLGPVGLAFAASIAAYLVGSLIQAILTAAVDLGTLLIRNRFRLSRFSSRTAMGFEDFERAPLFELDRVSWLTADQFAKISLRGLVNDRLGPSLARLQSAFANVRQRTKEVACIDYSLNSNSEPVMEGARFASVPGPGFRAPKDKELRLPVFSASRDLFDELSEIKNRLAEVAPPMAAEVDRLHAEAEFRVTMALPLAATVIVLALESPHPLWLILLAAPAGLILHAISLNKRAGREMIEALRTRRDEELNQITPVFSRYEERAGRLANFIESQDWEALSESTRIVEVGSAGQS